MAMKKGQKQYGIEFTNRIMRLHYDEGNTLTNTAIIMNVPRTVITSAITRQNSRLNKLKEGQSLNKLGRPIKQNATELDKLRADNKRLLMENDLLKNSTRS